MRFKLFNKTSLRFILGFVALVALSLLILSGSSSFVDPAKDLSSKEGSV